MIINKKFMLIVVFLNILESCAVYYHDEKTGAEHIWGFGHIVTKVAPPKEGSKAVIRRASLAGLMAGIENEAFDISAGWNSRERITVYDANSSLRIERPPSDDFFLFKIGSYPPALRTTRTNNQLNDKE
jgi:hypothetical protein